MYGAFIEIGNNTLIEIFNSDLKPNQKIQIGKSIILQVTGPCEPCPRMDEIRPGLMKEIDGKRGILAFVERGGIMNEGDKIEII